MNYSLNDRAYDSIRTYDKNGKPARGKMANRFLYKGIPLTITEMATLLGRSYACIHSRLVHGYAVDATFRKGAMPKTHIIEGRAFTAKDIANAFGMPIYNVYNRMRKCANTHTKMTLNMFVKL